MKKIFKALLFFAILSILIAACTPASNAPLNTTPAPKPQTKLAEITQRETIIIATDPAYPPFSSFDATKQRADTTKCSEYQYTANQFSGFEVDIAIEVAKQLGVEACFVTPTWEEVTSGNWNDAWDIHFGSMSITLERMKVLYFTQPYIVTPESIFVHETNTIFQKPQDLSGKRIGTCKGCTSDLYIRGILEMPGPPIDFLIKGVTRIIYDNEVAALEDLALGDGVRLDAVIAPLSTGVDAMKGGAPLRILNEPLFYAFNAAVIDKSSSTDVVSFVREVTRLIQQMHQNGTILEIANRNGLGADLIPPAANFYWAGLQQFK